MSLFYKEEKDKLYDYKIEEGTQEVKPVTPEEIRAQLKTMKKNKAADDSGLVSELLGEANDALMETMPELFSAVLQPGAALPSSWKCSSIRVLFKKGDPKIPETNMNNSNFVQGVQQGGVRKNKDDSFGSAIVGPSRISTRFQL